MKKSEIDKIEKMKKSLPYGKYIFSNGCQILFNRHYELLINGEPVKPDREMQFEIQNAKQQWFYDDSNTPWRNDETLRRCEHIQKAFGV